MAFDAVAWAAAGATGGRTTAWAGGAWVHPVGRSVSRRLTAAAKAVSAAPTGTVAGGAVVVGLLFFEIRYPAPEATTRTSRATRRTRFRRLDLDPASARTTSPAPGTPGAGIGWPRGAAIGFWAATGGGSWTPSGTGSDGGAVGGAVVSAAVPTTAVPAAAASAACSCVRVRANRGFFAFFASGATAGPGTPGGTTVADGAGTPACGAAGADSTAAAAPTTAVPAAAASAACSCLRVRANRGFFAFFASGTETSGAACPGAGVATREAGDAGSTAAPAAAASAACSCLRVRANRGFFAFFASGTE